jgi:hypothetical protein
VGAGDWPTEPELHAFCRDHLAAYQTPLIWIFVDASCRSPLARSARTSCTSVVRPSASTARREISSALPRQECLHGLDQSGRVLPGKHCPALLVDPDRDEAVLDLGIGESLLHAGAALGGEPLGALTEGVEVLGERIPRLLDLALDGVRVALHDAS